jgi:hypothetical protein
MPSGRITQAGFTGSGRLKWPFAARLLLLRVGGMAQPVQRSGLSEVVFGCLPWVAPAGRDNPGLEDEIRLGFGKAVPCLEGD